MAPTELEQLDRNTAVLLVAGAPAVLLNNVRFKLDDKYQSQVLQWAGRGKKLLPPPLPKPAEYSIFDTAKEATERAAKKAEEARAEIKAELRALRASFEAERDDPWRTRRRSSSAQMQLERCA